MELIRGILGYITKFNLLSFRAKLVWYFRIFGIFFGLLFFWELIYGLTHFYVNKNQNWGDLSFSYFNFELLFVLFPVFVIPNIFSVYVHHKISNPINQIPWFLKRLKNIPLILYLIYLFLLICILPNVDNIYDPFIQKVMFGFPTFFGHYSPKLFYQSIANIVPMLILLIPFWSLFNLLWFSFWRRIIKN